MIIFTISSFRIGKTPLPQEPTSGFKTKGNPSLFVNSLKDSALKVKYDFGEGI